MKTKKDINYSFQHTKNRILERYKKVIDRKWYDEMCERIKDGHGFTYLDSAKDSGDTQLIVKVENIIVVWSENRQCITTALKEWKRR